MPNFFGPSTAPSYTPGDTFTGYSAPAPAPAGGGGFWSGLGSATKAIAPLAPFGALMASNYIQGKQAEKSAQNVAQQNQQIAQQTAQQNQQVWQQNAYPRPAAVQAAASENRGQLGQARLGAYQNLASNLASRGWGSGSGLGVQGASNIERGYLQALGKQATDMTKFANTPMFGMPSQAYSSPVSGGTEQALSGMDSALGYYMMSQMLGR